MASCPTAPFATSSATNGKAARNNQRRLRRRRTGCSFFTRRITVTEESKSKTRNREEKLVRLVRGCDRNDLLLVLMT
jgi:hypothetical protein